MPPASTSVPILSTNSTPPASFGAPTSTACSTKPNAAGLYPCAANVRHPKPCYFAANSRPTKQLHSSTRFRQILINSTTAFTLALTNLSARCPTTPTLCLESYPVSPLCHHRPKLPTPPTSANHPSKIPNPKSIPHPPPGPDAADHPDRKRNHPILAARYHRPATSPAASPPRPHPAHLLPDTSRPLPSTPRPSPAGVLDPATAA